MPFTSNGGVRIYWEQEGRGDPLLMIMGLGFSHVMWRDLRPIMAAHFRTIVFDNRGVGKSDVPVLPYSMAAMARDAAAVLSAAGAECAHVLGMSMGGMIAQELTLQFPERVRKLVLGCTHCGGHQAVRAAPEVLRALAPHPFATHRQRLESIIPFIYGPHTPRERIESDAEVILRHRPTIRGYMGQLMAILAWQSYARLPCIQAPTLVIHGDSDRLIPPENAHILADRIERSKLVLLEDAGHIFPTDQPDHTVRELLGFLL